MMFPFSVWAGSPPQQTGAVPLTQGIADLASQLAKSVPEGHPMTIAVTDFPEKKKICGLGQFVAERLSTLLSRQPQCRLIERHRLDQVLQELRFSMSELVDPAKAKKLGQMLGVQGLVVGTVTDLGPTFDVDARIIDIQTDASLPGASASIIKDDATRQLSTDCSGGTQPPRPPPPPRAVSVEANNLLFAISTCKRSVASLTCQGSLTNQVRQRRLFRFGAPEFVDNVGNVYQSKWYPAFSTGQDSTELEPDTPYNFWAKQDEVEPSATAITLVITYDVYDPGRGPMPGFEFGRRVGREKVSMRGIPIK
jgi:TolB-like protein